MLMDSFNQYTKALADLSDTMDAASAPIYQKMEECIYSAVLKNHLDGSVGPPPFTLTDWAMIHELCADPGNAKFKAAVDKCQKTAQRDIAPAANVYRTGVEAVEDEAYRDRIRAGWMIITDETLFGRADASLAKTSWDGVDELPGPPRDGRKAIIFKANALTQLQAITKVDRVANELLLLFPTNGKRLWVDGGWKTLGTLAQKLRPHAKMRVSDVVYVAAKDWEKDPQGEEAIRKLFGAGTLKVVKANTARPRQVDTIRTWINAFIPEVVPGVTKVLVGTGTNSGKSCISTPPPEYCFLTDQRDFDSDPGASYRMRSVWDLDVPGGTFAEAHDTGITVEVDCADGSEIGSGKAATGRMKFSEFSKRLIGGGPRFQVKLRAAAPNPRFKPAGIAGDLDYWGFITVEVAPGRKSAIVRFSGKVDGFPAFEMYASCNGRPPQKIFTQAAGPDAKGLIGSAEKPVTGETVLTIP
jgi:hypothetical protein